MNKQIISLVKWGFLWRVKVGKIIVGQGDKDSCNALKNELLTSSKKRILILNTMRKYMTAGDYHD